MPADPKQSPVPLAEIVQGPNAFEQFLDRNQKNLIILAILIAVGVAAFVVYHGWEKSRQETAGQAFIKSETLASLQSVIKDHDGTVAAASAAILLAERQWTENQQDASVNTLRKFISSYPNHPAQPTAKASLGAKLMIQKKSGEATKLFKEIIDDPKARYIAPYALISMGDIAKLADDLKLAESSYNRVKNEFSESRFVDVAKERLASLKTLKPDEAEIPAVLTPGDPPTQSTTKPATATPATAPEAKPATGTPATAPEEKPATAAPATPPAPETKPESPNKPTGTETPAESKP